MPKPSEKFTWATLAIPGLEIIEPPDNKKNIGWLSQEKPPFQFFNWLFNVIGQWLDYIDSELEPMIDDLTPIGSWIIYNEYGGLVGPPNPDYYWPLNGTEIVDPDSPLNGVTVEDMSNRAIVGFGNEGGGDIISELYSSSPVGNANHQINLEHGHTVNAHNHSLSAHTHSGPAHTHSYGTLFTALMAASPGDNSIIWQQINGGQNWSANIQTPTFSISANGGDIQPSGVRVLGSTASDGNGDTGIPSTPFTGSVAPGTNNQLSATQSIQMRSQRVRFYVRYK